MNLISQYYSLLKSYPLVTQQIARGFLFSLGDGIAQGMESYFAKKENKSYEYNLKRVGIAWLMGFGFKMPVSHFKFPDDMQWLLFDLTFGACFSLFNYLMIINLLEKRSLHKGIDAIKKNFTKAIITNWQIWPAAQIINFWLIPKPYQVLWANFVAFFWSIYLSYIQHN